jgi:hypothetical protein
MRSPVLMLTLPLILQDGDSEAGSEADSEAGSERFGRREYPPDATKAPLENATTSAINFPMLSPQLKTDCK